MSQRYQVARLEDIPSPVTPDPGSYEWKPIRHQEAKYGKRALRARFPFRLARAGQCVAG